MELGRFGKKGSVDLNSFNQNIKKEQVKDKKMQKIYDAIDFNKDGKIDKQELTEFKKSIFTAAGNDRLSKREAKKLLKSIGLNDIKGKEMLEFLKTFSELEEEKPVVETPPAATAEPKKKLKKRLYKSRLCRRKFRQKKKIPTNTARQRQLTEKLILLPMTEKAIQQGLLFKTVKVLACLRKSLAAPLKI